MNESAIIQLHLYIKGRVQGVGFRHFVRQQAHSLGVSGWVRNRWNGSVEVLAEGDHSRLIALISVLREGPPHAQVSSVSPTWQPAAGTFDSFTIRSTQ